VVKMKLKNNLKAHLERSIKSIQETEKIFESVKRPDNSGIVDMIRESFITRCGAEVGDTISYSLSEESDNLETFLIARRKRFLYSHLIFVGFSEKDALELIKDE